MGKRFLFVIPPFHGHINPANAIARELLDRGHEVAWVTSEAMRDVLPKGSMIYDSLGNDYGLGHGRTRELTELPRAEQFFTYYRDLVLPAAVWMLEDVMRGCAEFKPDALFVDQHALAGAVVARRLDLPWASSAPTLQLLNPLPHLIQPWIDDQVAELGRACGVAELREVSDALILSYLSPLLAPADRMPAQTRFVGPAIDPGRFAERDILPLLQPGPKILVALSTIYGTDGDAFLIRLGQVLQREGIQGIFSSTNEEITRLPPPAVVRPWLPLLALMAHVNAVVTHGGSNTMEALYSGKPLVVAPLAYDNFMAAQAAVDAGAGIRLRVERATERDIARAVHEILDDPSYRVAAERIGASLRAGGGASAGADALLELVR